MVVLQLDDAIKHISFLCIREAVPERILGFLARWWRRHNQNLNLSTRNLRSSLPAVGAIGLGWFFGEGERGGEGREERGGERGNFSCPFDARASGVSTSHPDICERFKIFAQKYFFFPHLP